MPVGDNMFDYNFYALSNGLQKRILKEMASDLWKAKSIITAQQNTIKEHFIKMFLFDNATNDFNGWARTIANAIVTINNVTVKPKNKKLKFDDYLELAFGINNTFSESDAMVILSAFATKFSNKFEWYDWDSGFSKEQISGFFKKYKKLATTFSNYLSLNYWHDSLMEVKEKIIIIISNP